MTSSLRLSFFILWGLTVSCQAAVITVPPVSMTVPPLTTTTFTCEGTGDIFNWLVQSAVLTGSIAQQREITVTTTTVNNTNFSSVLTVNAIPDNDGLAIGCEVITFSPFNHVISSSELTIRGVSLVEDLQYNFTSNNSLLVTWLPPVYYSNDVPPGSPVSYQVLVTDQEDGDAILDTTIPDTNVEVPNVTECDTFNISVTALMAQYISNSNNERNNGTFSIAEYDTQPLIPSISFELGCPPSRSLVSLMDGNTEVTDVINETEHIIEFKLSPFRHYELTAVVKNFRDKTRATCSTSISTFHTQDLIISSPYTNGSVSVQCVFVLGSTADGCHVIFNDTSNGTVLNVSLVSLPLVQEPTLLSLPAGNYTVTAYDNVNGSLHGPAVQYPTLVEIIKMPSTSSSSTHNSSMSPTASIEIIPIPTSSTTIPTLGTVATSSTSETINDANNYIVLVVAGTVTGGVLIILIMLTVCAVIIVNKRKRTNGVLIRSEFATIQEPQAETNQYQAVKELRNEAVQLTYSRPIDEEEDPYHVDRSKFLTVNHTIPSHNVEGLMTQEPRPSLTSMTTQETTLGYSISSTALNDSIHDNTYITDPDATNTITVTVKDTATATHTYAVVGKRTDATPLPTVDQRVVHVYDTVTGDINKRGGGVTVYPPDDISAIPPPPSYAATIEQESATVSNSQFKVPEQVTDDAAVVHGKYGKYPPTNIEDDYDINTPVQVETRTSDAQIVVQPRAPLATLDSNFANDRKGGSIIVESPMKEFAPIQFRETEKNVFFEKSLLVDSLFEEDEIVHDHIFDHISDEMVGVKPRPVVLNSRKKTGTLVTGLASKVELAIYTACHEVQTSKNEYQTQKVPKVITQHPY